MPSVKVKVCPKCGVEKPLDDFYKQKRSKDGLSYMCKECNKLRTRKYHQENKERLKEYQKVYNKENKEMVAEKKRLYHLKNKEKDNEYAKQYRKKNKEILKEKKRQYCKDNEEEIKKRRVRYYQRNKETIKERTKQYRQENIEWEKEYQKQYRQKNKEQAYEYQKQYRQDNREILGKNKNKYIKKRYRKDPEFKLRFWVSNVIRCALKRNKGSKQGQSVLQYLPYTIQELKEHLEAQFEPWMTWDNHGVYVVGGPRVWHIDHIVPQSALPYDSMDHPNFQKCWKLENLRPLEALGNIQKSNKIIGTGDLDEMSFD